MSQQIIHSKEIFPFIKAELSRISKQFIIVSAYIKVTALKEIDSYLTSDIEKILLVRFRKSDIIAKSTDIELYDYCEENGWKMYFNLDLHSKIYVFDKNTYLIGSANATLSGLGLKAHSNIESAVVGECTPHNYNKILEVFDTAHLMTDAIILEFKKQIDDASTTIFEEWFLHEIKIPKKAALKNLWVCDFPTSPSPLQLNEQDLALLGLLPNSSLGFIQSKFKSVKCYEWLCLNVKDEIYFGELTAKLHNALIDDPKPYRKEVKEILATLLTWISILKMDDFIIDRPNHSQRIRKILM
ncbi:phospholipase D family protein [Lysinibacillus boronitolerans]|uniref:phospholipase D family protein n=1 Tax=Lysinibacillus boronitolerans TaxID=309788 RepID=UPI00289C3F9F|nr:phospholipase D family protein [Bacillus mobilis]